MKCDIGGWNVYECRCKSCFYRWMAVAPTTADPKELECGQCGAQSSQAKQVPKTYTSNMSLFCRGCDRLVEYCDCKPQPPHDTTTTEEVE